MTIGTASTKIYNSVGNGNIVSAGDKFKANVKFQAGKDLASIRIKVYVPATDDYGFGYNLIDEYVVTKSHKSGSWYEYDLGEKTVKNVSSSAATRGWSMSGYANVAVKVYGYDKNGKLLEQANLPASHNGGAVSSIGRYVMKINNPTVSITSPTNVKPTGLSGYYANLTTLTVNANISIDTRDPAVTISKSTLKVTKSGQSVFEKSVSGSTKFIDFSTVKDSGTYRFEWTVIDSKNNSSKATADYYYNAYTKPKISAVGALAQRMGAVTTESGSVVNQASDDGEMLQVSYSATCMRYVAGKENTLTIKVEATPASGSAKSQTMHPTITPTSDTITATQTAIAFQSGIASNTKWTIKITATDDYSSASTSATVKAFACTFDIEKYGVAIGKLSTGTSSSKKFECAYNSYFSSLATFSAGISTNKIEITGSGSSLSGKNSYYEYSSGDTITFNYGNSGAFIGHTTDLAREIRISIPLSKHLNNINNVTVNEFTCRIWNDGGWAAGTKYDDASINYKSNIKACTISKITNRINIHIYRDTSYNLKSNTPVICTPSSIKITLS